MNGETYPPKDDNQERQRAMYDSLESSVENEDYEFMLEIAKSQQLVGPTDLAEHMYGNMDDAEDPVLERRWRDGLEQYLEFMHKEGWKFSAEQIDTLIDIEHRLRHDTDVDDSGGPEVEDESRQESVNTKSENRVSSEINYMYKGYNLAQDADNWDEDEFIVGLEEDEAEQIRSLQVFQEVEQEATGKGTYQTADNRLAEARNIIDDHVEDENTRRKMFSLLDYFVFQAAEQEATGKGTYQTAENRLAEARNLINNAASDSMTAGWMESALDKHVFHSAKKEATGKGKYDSVGNRFAEAKLLINSFASTPARREAMFRRLGF